MHEIWFHEIFYYFDLRKKIFNGLVPDGGGACDGDEVDVVEQVQRHLEYIIVNKIREINSVHYFTRFLKYIVHF